MYRTPLRVSECYYMCNDTLLKWYRRLVCQRWFGVRSNGCCGPAPLLRHRVVRCLLGNHFCVSAFSLAKKKHTNTKLTWPAVKWHSHTILRRTSLCIYPFEKQPRLLVFVGGEPLREPWVAVQMRLCWRLPASTQLVFTRPCVTWRHTRALSGCRPHTPEEARAVASPRDVLRLCACDSFVMIPFKTQNQNCVNHRRVFTAA